MFKAKINFDSRRKLFEAVQLFYNYFLRIIETLNNLIDSSLI